MWTVAIHTRDETGQTMAEYAVILGVITLAVVTSFGMLSGAIEFAYGETIDLISSIA
jgi:Flp pilus assembly pilin Flp